MVHPFRFIESFITAQQERDLTQLRGASMSTTLIQYDVYEEVREFLDEILLSFRREVVEEYEKAISLLEAIDEPHRSPRYPFAKSTD